MTITALESPSSHLTNPQVQGEGWTIWQLRMKSGIVFGTADMVVSWLAGFSPLEEWIFKPLGGDWTALDRGAVAWRNAGTATSAVARNIAGLPAQIGDSWVGDAAESFETLQATLAEAVEPIPDACSALSEQCSALASLARAIADFVAGILTDLQNWGLKMLVATAVPGAQVTLPVWIAELAAKIARWVPKLTGMINTFVQFLTRIWPTVQRIVKVIQTLQTILSKLNKLVPLLKAAPAAMGPAAVAV